MKKLLMLTFIIFAVFSSVQGQKNELIGNENFSLEMQKFNNEMQASLLRIERLQRLFYENIWRAQIAFAENGEFLIYAEPSSNDWCDATKLFMLDLKSEEKTQLFKEFSGRFSYPSISSDSKKLAFQFQKGTPPSPLRFDAPFFERKLFVADVANLEQPPTQLTLSKPASLFNTELIPEFYQDAKKIFVSVGKINSQERNESPRILLADTENHVKTEFTKGREFNKSTEFSPLINPHNGNLFTLLNKTSDSRNFSLFRRVNREKEKGCLHPKFNNITEFYTPRGVGVFEECKDVELTVNWLTTATVSPKIACQVGNWNLFSLVMLDSSASMNSEPQVILEGTSKISYARPSLAPGGKWIAYEKIKIYMPEKAFLIAKIISTEIWLKNLANNEVIKIADDACQPLFSADGTKIAYFKKVKDKWEIQVYETSIKPEEQGLLSSKIAEQIGSLIEKLGSDDYKTRETAKIALMRLGSKILQKLRNYEKTTDDPEVKFRIKEIIDFITSEAPSTPTAE